MRYNAGDYPPSGEFVSYGNYNDLSVEIPAYGEKNVKIFIEPSHIFQRQNYNDLVSKYRGYDKLVIFERKGQEYIGYRGCYNLNDDIIEKGTKIKLKF